jgi:hypothetical protein
MPLNAACILAWRIRSSVSETFRWAFYIQIVTVRKSPQEQVGGPVNNLITTCGGFCMVTQGIVAALPFLRSSLVQYGTVFHICDNLLGLIWFEMSSQMAYTCVWTRLL